RLKVRSVSARTKLSTFTVSVACALGSQQHRKLTRNARAIKENCRGKDKDRGIMKFLVVAVMLR
ncbi:hypothetical protein N9Z96_00005, partial [bacterium]|nr:hypothetical protein [bacterium]